MLRLLTLPFTVSSSDDDDGFLGAAGAGASTAVTGSTTTPAAATPAVSTVLRVTWGMTWGVLGAVPAGGQQAAGLVRGRAGGCAWGSGREIAARGQEYLTPASPPPMASASRQQ